MLTAKVDICISESRLSKNNPVTLNLDNPGYTFKHIPTEPSAGGTLMYISNDISYILQNDLQVYSPKELELIFIEIIIPNKPSSILGIIYKHLSMKLFKFNNKFLEPLLFKIKAESKATFLAVWDLNFNLIKYNQNKGTADLPEHLFSNNFTLHITLPMRSTLTSQTLINNILLNNQLHWSVSGNLTTSISDHLPQVIILENLRNFDFTRKINSTYRNLKNSDKKCFSEELKSIDWSLATKNNDLDLSFRIFFHLFNKALDKQGIRKDKK